MIREKNTMSSLNIANNEKKFDLKKNTTPERYEFENEMLNR